MSNSLSDFYRYPKCLLGKTSADGSHSRVGGRDDWPEAPDDVDALIDYFRLEKYARAADGRRLLGSGAVRWLYYLARPILPDRLRYALQRVYFADRKKLSFPIWPVDFTVETVLEQQLASALDAAGATEIPFIWFWPRGASAAAMMTHDVETSDGVEFIPELISVDESFGIRSAYQIVPTRRYEVTGKLLETIRGRGLEVNVHGLDHDGNLFEDRARYERAVKEINRYAREFGAEGFRSSCMYRCAEWLRELDVQYDMSIPNVAHLEPQRGGCCTVFPYFIGDVLELPLTTVQDFALFNILQEDSIDLWKTQIDAIMDRHGLISFIAHPDYLRPRRHFDLYKQLLSHLSELRDSKRIWIAAPREVNWWWRLRAKMEIVASGKHWRIEGEGAEWASLAVARVEDGRISYRIESPDAWSGHRPFEGDVFGRNSRGTVQ